MTDDELDALEAQWSQWNGEVWNADALRLIAEVRRLRAAERLVEMQIRHEDCCNLRLASTDADERQRLWDAQLALMREIDAGFAAYRKARSV